MMHRLLFTDTLWLFPSSDTLIQVFPNDFFVLFAKQFSINVITTSILLILVSLVARRFVRKLI